ncbi:Retrovirus-related Pol polyprotein from type-2 retrotransposable element R2DM [Symbiodinium microadriaticum]|uniref:Retrovirus-related Pol polyprotein from type-2 retrotransposable element R2DM n=1 Tax=Symbiodinium microadriaticum TaxID=2951 RepID=A0A1Q9EVI4_SYMMI|nr:Retrovirus-related Pol polyprotein from type-2 retrotransposable element R2DM [Symbiodinium microadriaticum]
MQQFPADAFSLQQLDISELEVPRYTTAWKQAGAQVFLSRPEVPTNRRRVGLVTTLHGRAFHMPPHSLAATRIAAALVQVQSGGQPVHLVLGAVYGFPNDGESTDQVVQEFLAIVKPLRCRFLLFGDFNWQRGEGGVLDNLISTGHLRCLDDAFHGVLPTTSPTRARRIDFAVAHPAIAATAIEHMEGPGDHVAVAYTLDLDINFAGHRLPPRAHFVKDRCVEKVEALFQSYWCEADFNHCLQQDRLNEAWGYLSATAERALGARPGTAQPRAFDPIPQPSDHLRRHLRPPRESRGLGGLRRLLRRLRQLYLEPGDERLRRNIVASFSGLRGLVPELPYFSDDFEEAGAVVARLVQQYEQQEATARFDNWHCTDKSFAQCCAWVKRKADHAQAVLGPPRDIKAATAVHPTQILGEQSEVWKKLWTQPSKVSFDSSSLRQVLAELPRPVDMQVELQITAEGLRKATKRMIKKAGGPDGWEASDLVLLPLGFWESAARLWNRALDLGVLPESWSSALVVLLPKPDGRTRPVGLLAIMWRAGARCLVKQLRGWVSSWTTHQAMGGIAGVGVTDSHLRLIGAQKRGCQAFVKQDLSHFFDSLKLEVVLPLLEHYRAPPALSRIVSAVYRQSKRLFRVEQFTSPEFVTVNQGVVQGCPLSPLLSVLRTPEIQSLVYIDDRLLWPTLRTSAAEESMRTALQRSDFFDNALGLQCKPEKCALAHHPQQTALVPLMRQRGYPCEHDLEFLGVRFHLESFSCVPLKLNLEKVRWRLRYLRRLGAPLGLLRLLVTALVSSALFWAGGVAKPEEADLKLVANELYSLFKSHFLREAPKILIHELLGWRSEPSFACDMAAFQAVSRQLTQFPEWKDRAPLTEAFESWQTVLPVAVQAVARLGWVVVHNGQALQRVDDLGRLRTFSFGWESLEVLEDWLRVEYRRVFMRRCGRVNCSYHRQEDFAKGLDLPAPGVQDYYFLGHRKVFGYTPLRSLNGGLLLPRCHGRLGVVLDSGRRQEPTSHGPVTPQRSVDLDWRRLSTVLRRDCTLEAAVEVEQLSGGNFGFQDFELTTPEASNELWLIAATDGSHRDGVGAYSVALPGGRGGGAGDGAEDQGAFRNELKALQVLFQAVQLAGQRGLLPRVLWVVVDCQAALLSLQDPEASSLPLLASSAAATSKELQRAGWQVRPFWCPSHGKRLNWCAPAPLPSALCRLLNDKAVSMREVAQWEERAILASAKAGELFGEKVKAETRRLRAAAVAPT